MRVLIILILVSLPLMAQENVGVGVDGRLQTSRIASSGSGSGGNGYQPKWWDLSIGPAADSLDYDFEIIDLSDSTEFTDSLNIAVDSLSALATADTRGRAVLYIAPGEYLVCDTVFGPPTGDSYTQIVISGQPSHEPPATRLIISAGPDTVYGSLGKFWSDGSVSKVWRDVDFRWLEYYSDEGAWPGVISVDTTASTDKDNTWFSHCRFQSFNNGTSGPWTSHSLVTTKYDQTNQRSIYVGTGTGTGWLWRDCVFDSVYSIALPVIDVTFDRCRWTGRITHGVYMLWDGDSYGKIKSAMTFTDNVFRANGSTSSYHHGPIAVDDYQIANIRNTTFWNHGDFYYGLAGIAWPTGVMNFSNCSFLNDPTAVGDETYAVSVQANSKVSYQGCYFEGMIVTTRDGGGILGCTFRDSSYAQVGGGNVIGNNIIGPSAYGIHVWTGSNAVVGANSGFGSFGVWIQDDGTTTDIYDNHDH